MSSALALQRFPLLHTHSMEVVEQLHSSNLGRTVLEQTDRRAAFEWQANRIVLGGLALTAGRYGAGVRATSDNVHGIYSMLIPQYGCARSTQGGEVSLLPGSTAALVSASLPAAVEVETNYQGFGIHIAASLVDSTLDMLTGPRQKAPLRLEGAVDLKRGVGAELVRLLQFMLDGAERDQSVLRAPIIESRISETFVMALLLGVPHNYSRLLHKPQRLPEPRHVRRAQDYMEANAHRAITGAEVARATGIPLRALNAAFRAHRGLSPTRFLRERRFALARTRLATSAATTVAEVAVASGFAHLGRFSAEYKRRFGESPAQTLKRARLHHGKT